MKSLLYTNLLKRYGKPCKLSFIPDRLYKIYNIVVISPRTQIIKFQILTQDKKVHWATTKKLIKDVETEIPVNLSTTLEYSIRVASTKFFRRTRIRLMGTWLEWVKYECDEHGSGFEFNYKWNTP